MGKKHGKHLSVHGVHSVINISCFTNLLLLFRRERNTVNNIRIYINLSIRTSNFKFNLQRQKNQLLLVILIYSLSIWASELKINLLTAKSTQQGRVFKYSLVMNCRTKKQTNQFPLTRNTQVFRLSTSVCINTTVHLICFSFWDSAARKVATYFLNVKLQNHVSSTFIEVKFHKLLIRQVLHKF